MNYKNLSDSEINREVAKAIGHEVTQFSAVNIGRQWCIKEPCGDDWVPVKIPDYCNSPSDAFYIISSIGIDIKWRNSIKSGPMASLSGNSDIYHVDKNPLRAAMIVFLLSNQKDS